MRRWAEQLYPSRETRRYEAWIERRVSERQREFETPVEPGLFSLLTAVWDGSPARHLRTLIESVQGQTISPGDAAEGPHQSGPCEWVILDNGCRKRELVEILEDLCSHRWVKLLRRESNVGITPGLRSCLEQATGRYVLPVDADDVLYPDALKVAGSCVRANGYPPLLYTDEDKVIGQRVYQPYLKPDWDPVLLLNSAYIAHLGVMERRVALELGVYSDSQTEGSPDWDAFVRFLAAGYRGIHVPEVVYSWRVHAQSTADDAATKPYIHSSQKAVLERFLEQHREGHKFQVEYNPFFGGAAHWRLARKKEGPVAIALTRVVDPRMPAGELRQMAQAPGLICLLGQDVEIDDADWMWEATGLFELHADAAMVGGRIRNRHGEILEAGRYFGVRGLCGCPYRGRADSDPGYFGQLWKQRSVSAVSTQFAVLRADFLRELLDVTPQGASLGFLGVWAGAHALRTGKRVVYSPFLSGICDVSWDAFTDSDEEAEFAAIYGDVAPDRRFYPPYFSLSKPFELADEPRTLPPARDRRS